MIECLYGIEWLTPLVFTIMVALLTSTLSQLSFKIFTDNTFLKDSQKEMKKMQKRLLKMNPEDEEYMKLQNQLLDLNMQVMTHSLKPTLLTMIPFLIIFGYAKSVIPLDQPLITFPFSIPLVGNSLEFIGSYLITSLIASSVLRKVLGR